jgi:beta-fructofuranosidase
MVTLPSGRVTISATGCPVAILFSLRPSTGLPFNPHSSWSGSVQRIVSEVLRPNRFVMPPAFCAGALQIQCSSFSEYSEESKTRYRMARSLKGPWLSPSDDTFDGRAFYAAKTASDGKRRFLFGWLPTRTDGKDYRSWNWGGNLVVHEILQAPDGRLLMKIPDTVDAAFSAPQSFRLSAGLGSAQIDGGMARLAAPGSFGCSSAGPMPQRAKIEATIEFEKMTRGCGIMLRSSEDYESGYYVRLEPGRNRLVFDAWPRPGDMPFMVELERPLDLRPATPVRLKIIADGSCGVVYAGGTVAMSFRMYDLPKGNWGVFVNDGAARFRDIRLSTA